MRIACTSEPASGSVIEKAARNTPSAIRGRYRSFCSSVPCAAIMPPTMYWPLTMPEIDVQPRESSRDRQRVGHQVEAHAAVLLRDAHAERAHLAQRLHHRLGEDVRLLVLAHVREDVAVDVLAQRAQQLDLVLVEVDALEGGDVDGHGRRSGTVVGTGTRLSLTLAPATCGQEREHRQRHQREAADEARMRARRSRHAPHPAWGHPAAGRPGDGAPASPRCAATAMPSGSWETPQRRSSRTALISPPTSRHRFESQSQISMITAVAKAP